ncbi:hypothetical protein VNO78_28377 [Psophocarpus tetragonolobus]|uniref:PLAT domain-containing protein n=1 Tax=Psophocarpus tetragonolobus TaxID=3891 RepID=A0AAN9S228_PSOTE
MGKAKRHKQQRYVMATKWSVLVFVLWLCLAGAGTVRSEEDCVYTLYVRTGSIIKGGTDSKIGVKLYNKYGKGIYIKNLHDWGGLMGPHHSYFERGNLDIFSGKAPCFDGPVCRLNLTSDGSGAHHGWYVNYVEVTTTGVHTPCAQHQFTIEQWLATDASPYKLWAFRDYCPSILGQAHTTSSLPFSLLDSPLLL